MKKVKSFQVHLVNFCYIFLVHQVNLQFQIIQVLVHLVYLLKIILEIENILKENTTETMVSKLENNKEKINKKLANLLELNLEGKINKEQYTEKFDNLNVELLKIEQKIENLLKETNRTESIKLRLNKFKSLFKNIDIMPKFDKDIFECLMNKVVIGETLEDGTINPYTIRFICKNGTEINCKDRFTAMSDKQHSNNTATKEKQHTWNAWQCYN